MDRSPLVTIVMPVYNLAQFLPQALSSALSQTYPSIEIVIINDGSTDETGKIIDEFAGRDRRVRPIHQENRGFASAMNRGIQESRGDYIAHLDGDDLIAPEKIEKQLEIFCANPEVDFVYTAIYVINAEGNTVGEQRGSDEVDSETFLAKMCFRNIVPNPTTMMGKRACCLNTPFNEIYRYSSDYDRLLRLAQKYRLKYLDLPLTYWRRHDLNVTNKLELLRGEQREILKQYDVSVLMGFVDRSKLSVEEKLLLKGGILYNLELWNQALEKFERVTGRVGRFYSGNCYVKLGDLGKAARYYRECLAFDQSNAACWNNLGVALAMSGEQGEADRCFQLALEKRVGYLDPEINRLCRESGWRLTERELRSELIPYKID